MLLLFSAENFRSIKEEQTLSMIASPYYRGNKASNFFTNQEQVIDYSLPGLSKKSFLRTAAIYGANGSGKSNVIHALARMKEIVADSASYALEDAIAYEPFAFDNEYLNRPTTFFIAFEWQGVRYEYEFSYKEMEILEERLCSFPKGIRRLVFERTVGKDKLIQIRGSAYLRVNDAVRGFVNPNQLFVSFLCNHPGIEGYEIVQPVGDYFKNGLIVLDQVRDRWLGFPVSGQVLDGEEGSDYQRSLIKKMIRDADFGISDACVQKRRVPRPVLDKSSGEKGEMGEARTLKHVVLQHKTDAGGGSLSLMDESLGTIQLFSLSSYIGFVLENDATLVVDELDASLHPSLVEEIVALFQKPELINRRAQLLFTAHQTPLMSREILGRDQIWFTEKTSQGNTVLYPLSDYSPRKGESIERGYLMGRYSGVPIFPDDFGYVPLSARGRKDGE